MPRDVRFWVNRYTNEGWSPIPIPAGEKGPRVSGWEQKTFAVSDFTDSDNVGVHLGKTGLYDVDLDDKMAAIAADIILPTTNRISGRPGKPRSHRFFTCDASLDPIVHVAYHGLGGNNDTIIELRGLSKNGAPTQTVLPPSIHPSGEEVEWAADGKPFHCTLKEQVLQWERGVRHVAMAVLIARAWPGPGHRHNPRMALAGYLHRAGLDDHEVMSLGLAVMKLTGSDENDWRDTARTTLAKLKADANAAVTGGPQLREALADGEQVLKKLNLWLGRTSQAEHDEAIEKFNRRHFIVTVGTTPCVGDDSNPERIDFYTYQHFRDKYIHEKFPGHKAPDKVSKTGVVTPGKWVEGKGIADEWLKHPKARRFDHFGYWPPPLVAPAHDYNGWKGFACEPAPGDFPLIEAHIKHVICGGSVELMEWVMNWCAALVQWPARHAWTAISLQGGQGTGKGFFAEDLLGSLFAGRHFIKIANSQQFYHRFAGELLSGRCLVFLDEATWGGNKQDAGLLKSYITGDTLTVDRKNIAAVSEPSMLHLIIASNEAWPVGVERDDRRIVACQCDNEQANKPEYFEPLYQELRNGGREAFLHAMLNWPINERALRQPPMTEAKANLKIRSLPPEAEWWQERLIEGRVLKTDKSWAKRVDRAAAHAEYIESMQTLSINRRLGKMHFFHRMLEFCPSAKFIKPMGKPRVFEMPSLDRARADFEKYLKAKINWDDPEEAKVQQDVPF